MAYGADVLHRLDDAVLRVGDGLEYQLDGDDVVGALVLEADVGDAGRLMVDDRAFDADALDDAAGQDVLRITSYNVCYTKLLRRRRTGVLIFAKSWAIDLDMVTAIELDADYNGADQGDPYARNNFV